MPAPRPSLGSLSGNDVGEKGATAIAAILNETEITKLNLRDNRLGPRGGAALAKGLKGNSILKSLDLEGNFIRYAGTSALAAILNETKITNLLCAAA